MKIRRLTDTGEWTTRRYLSLLGNILIWVIVAIDAFYLWPTQLHGSTSMVIVSGHSMEPTYFSGDLVIARKMEPSVGDVIVYAPDGFGGSQIVHRIIGGNATDGWQMQGDNNDFIDPFTPKGSEVKGVVLVHYANFGRVTVLLLNPIVWAFVLIAAIVLLVWWSGDSCEDDPKDEDKKDGDGESEPEAEDEPGPIDRMVERTEATVSRTVASGTAVGAAGLALLTRRSPLARHAAPVPHHAAPAYLRGSAIVAVLGLLAVLGPSAASASQLIVKPAGEASVQSVAKCATLNLSVTPSELVTGTTYRQATVSGIATACLNKTITVYMHNTAGANFAAFSGTTPAPDSTTASTMTLTLSPSGATFDASLVNKVVVKIDGWLFVATWLPDGSQPTTPAFPAAGNCDGVLVSNGQLLTGVTCNLTSQSNTRGYWDGANRIALGVQANTAFNPSGTQSEQYQESTYWRFTVNILNLPSAGLLGDLNSGFYLYKDGNLHAMVAPGETCSNPAKITLQEAVASGDPSAQFIVSGWPIPGKSAADLICQGP